MKKDFYKCFMITVVGLSVAILFYPFLHECGHAIASLCVGAEIKQITLLPLPSILCDVGGVSDIGRVIIGLNGALFPAVVAFLFPRRWFWFWFVRFLLLGISVFTVVISVSSVHFGINHQDDLFQVLQFWTYDRIYLTIFLVAVAVAAIAFLILDKPVKRVFRYFEI